jgi:hypothetical protein
MDEISVERELGAVFLGRTDTIFFPRLKNFLLKKDKKKRTLSTKMN